MSESSYLPNHNPTPAYAALSYLGLHAHENEWQHSIMSHCFNHKLAAFLPFCTIEQAREHLKSTAGMYYHIELSLTSLLEHDFFTRFIQSQTHDLLLHSLGTDLDTDNVIVLDHQGNLILSLLKPTYQSFGITTHQHRQDKLRGKYAVKVDLRKLKTDGKAYQQLLRGLKNTFPDKIKMAAAYIDKVTGETCNVSWPKDVAATEYPMELTFEQFSNLNIPTFDKLPTKLSENPGSEWQQGVQDALEWIGLAYIKANRIQVGKEHPDPFISIYRAPEPSIRSAQGVLVQCTGLVPAQFIRHIVVTIGKMMESKTIERWTAVSVWGYRDSPFTWDNLQHYYHVNGENDTTFLMLPPAIEKEITMISFQMYGTDHIPK
ncbi:hypothetical protein LRAMOSA09601 [Lichtheimia ramosa]|uniref:Uncharacterized protein n=1 Tax=Lichtheimia ramosa TaxID=688394 RepID=A0A077WJ59_9FUNG|nr:hypothetical protein LRAMOSA09601 [Lichtheimia ramosa]